MTRLLMAMVLLGLFHPLLPMREDVTVAGINENQFVQGAWNYCDEFTFCGAIYGRKWYRVPWPCLPIPKELR